MRRGMILLLLLLLLSGTARAAELVDTGSLESALPSEARDLLEGIDPEVPGDLGQGVLSVLTGAIGRGHSALRGGIALCCELLAVVLLAATLRGVDDGVTGRAVTLAAALAIGVVCMGGVSSLFETAARTVDQMAAFSGFLFLALASATAATGVVTTAAALHGVTVLLTNVMVRAAEGIFLPGVSCCAALAIAGAAVGDDSLKPAGAMLRWGMTVLLKAAVLGFTAYLSISGVVSGAADSAAIKAAKLAISSVVPVVGGMIADASETVLVSAGLLRSGIGVFGLLGVLAVSVGPFLEMGCRYLLLKGTSAVAGAVGEKELFGLIGEMAGAMGLLTGLTGACALMLMIACVCFMRASP